MANGGMSPNEVRSTVNSVDKSEKTTNTKAIQKGCNLGGKSSSGSMKESGFKRGPNQGKSA
jgi:hypothetical protein